MDCGVAMRTNTGRASRNAPSNAEIVDVLLSSLGLLHTHMVPGATFKQWLLSGLAHVRDGVNRYRNAMSAFTSVYPQSQT
jgi:hypothetical protein